jgi:hypothetical protein
MILARTPEDANASATVHGFTAGVYVAAAAGCLLVVIAVAGWRDERRRAAVERGATTYATNPDAIGAEPLEMAA